MQSEGAVRLAQMRAGAPAGAAARLSAWCVCLAVYARAATCVAHSIIACGHAWAMIAAQNEENCDGSSGRAHWGLLGHVTNIRARPRSARMARGWLFFFTCNTNNVRTPSVPPRMTNFASGSSLRAKTLCSQISHSYSEGTLAKDILTQHIRETNRPTCVARQTRVRFRVPRCPRTSPLSQHQ